MRRNYLVSTDCAAIVGNAHLWKRLWSVALSDPYCHGVEMIGWKWSTALIKEAHSLKIPIIGIHGRTAGWSEGRSLGTKALMGLLNMVFLSQSELCKIGKNLSYILLHRSTITPDVVKLLEIHKESLPLVVIENVLVRNDFERTLETISYLREKGIQVGLTFDVVHFLREPEFSSPQLTRFSGLIHALNHIAQYDFPVNIHFPIGTYENDSLPLQKLSPQMWKELAHGIHEINPQYIVLENQQARAYSVFLPPWKHTEVVMRNKWIVELLKEKEII